MIRVGFILPEWELEWLGGLNYYRNLLSAVQLLPDCEIRLVVFTGSDAFDQIPGVEVVKERWLRSNHASRNLWRLLRRFRTVQSVALRILLRRHCVDVVSHFGPLPKLGLIRSIGWIPDFQHIHLSTLFSPAEIASRNKLFQSICDDCDHIVVSSESARKDLLSLHPDVSPKTSILRFVPEVIFSSEKNLRQLQQEYDFSTPFFFLPNQFWVHKNHRVVIEALDILRSCGVDATVVATGKTSDYRNREHYAGLKTLLVERRLEDRFRVLGIVPYEDLLEMMHHSIAVINPSLFEGWSTTVEEAIALRKQLILSDIPVHREQNPDFAVYFPANDSESLAKEMRNLLSESWLAPQCPLASVDFVAHSRRRLAFASAYVDIIKTLCRDSASRAF